MKKKFLLLVSLFLISSLLPVANVHATTEKKVEPYKTEQLILDDGTVIPIYYFENPEDGDKHRERLASLHNTSSPMKLPLVNLSNNEPHMSPLGLFVSYKMIRYGGTLKYNFDVQYTYNGTSLPQSWKPTVSRSTSSETSIKVGSDFDKAFKAEVGLVFKTTETWSHTFDFVIPPRKQYEIWTWNIAEHWGFRKIPLFGSSVDFTVYRPTSTYGHAIYVFDKPRDPR